MRLDTLWFGSVELFAMAEGSTALSEFNLLVQRVNSLSRSINRLVYRIPMDLKSVEGLVSDLESIMDKVDDVYSVVFDTFGDSLSQKVKDKYDLVSRNSSEVLVNAYKNMMKARESEKSERDCLNRSEMLENLVSQVNISRLPSPEPDVFDGDPLEYNSWFNAFETLISTRNIPKNERIFYLRKYLSGPARDCVQGLLSLCSEDAYDDALKMLKERFGSDFIIANALRQKVRNWPQVSSNDYVGLRKFSDFLSQVLLAKQSLPSLKCLDDPQENRLLLFKIPDWCHRRWCRKVVEATNDGRGYPSFKDFVDFLKFEAEVVNNPITNISSPTDVASPTVQSFSTVLNVVSHRIVVNQVKSVSCYLCKGNHVIEKCGKFLEKSYSNRVIFVKQKRLCFGCLRKGHFSKDCKTRASCSICLKSHPVSLHNSTCLNLRESLIQSSASEEISSSGLSENLSLSENVPVIISNQIVCKEVTVSNDSVSTQLNVHTDSESSSTKAQGIGSPAIKKEPCVSTDVFLTESETVSLSSLINVFLSIWLCFVFVIDFKLEISFWFIHSCSIMIIALFLLCFNCDSGYSPPWKPLSFEKIVAQF